MSIVNIVDERTNKYNIRCDAVLEASCHDNGIAGASIFDHQNEGFVQTLSDVSVRTAIDWANLSDGCITIFMYDVNSGAIPDMK